jgi:c-di-GMP-binding flagellar brake protein YcgR
VNDDKRIDLRNKFAYPVTFNLFLSDFESRPFTGSIYNISIGGACILFEEKNGQIDVEKMKGSRIKLTVGISQGERIHINALIHWIRRDVPQNIFSYLMGIKFKEIADWQADQIEKFMQLKNKDHKMIWSLWERYLHHK